MNRVDYRFEKLEKKKQALMQLLATIPKEKYLIQPTDHSWSIGQTVNHVYLSEKLSLAYLKKKLSYPDTVPPFSLKSWGAVLLIKFTLHSPYKVKAPKAINMWEQQDVLSPAELAVSWNSLREELISFIRLHQPAMGSHLAFNHPFAGRMTMHQMLIFLDDHLAHHTRQINRIVKRLE